MSDTEMKVTVAWVALFYETLSKTPQLLGINFSDLFFDLFYVAAATNVSLYSRGSGERYRHTTPWVRFTRHGYVDGQMFSTRDLSCEDDLFISSSFNLHLGCMCLATSCTFGRCYVASGNTHKHVCLLHLARTLEQNISAGEESQVTEVLV
jgi:hypothetical protein